MSAFTPRNAHATIESWMEDPIQLPRGVVRLPIELEPGPGFRPDEQATWPKVEGRLEYVDGRLLYMPPCGLMQAAHAVEVVYLLRSWSAVHPEFVVGGNEVGMIFGRDVRGAEAAVWRAEDVEVHSHKVVSHPPILAVEVAGAEPENLLQKAAWYLQRGVKVVWIVWPESRDVSVVTSDGETRHREGEGLPPHEALPGLEPEVNGFFAVGVSR